MNWSKTLKSAVFVCFCPGKFEEKEDRVPKLEQLNSLGFMCSLNLVLNKRDLIKMELLLLETFGWNLCMPTPAHFIDYYLHASVQEGDLYNGWPLSSLSKTKAFMDKYTHYFLEVSLQGRISGESEPRVFVNSLISMWCELDQRIYEAHFPVFF